MGFEFKKTEIEGLIHITPDKFSDDRGYFMETYKLSDFVVNGVDVIFKQDNQSYSTENVIRGIHFQKEPRSQGKLVRCINGTILDVAVDLRPDSPTFKKWLSFELSASNRRMLYIPEGFGHGFSVLSSTAEICYKCTNLYDSDLDAGIRFDDPELNIDWGVKDPVISDKDKKLPTLSEFLKN